MHQTVLLEILFCLNFPVFGKGEESANFIINKNALYISLKTIVVSMKKAIIITKGEVQRVGYRDTVQKIAF